MLLSTPKFRGEIVAGQSQVLTRSVAGRNLYAVTCWPYPDVGRMGRNARQGQEAL